MTMAANPVRLLTLSTVVASVAVRILSPHLLPHGPAVDVPADYCPEGSSFDPSNVSLRLSSGGLTKIYERFDDDEGGEGRRPRPLLVGPETIVFDGDGTMFLMNEDAKLVSLADFRPREEGGDESILTARATEVADLGPGRPLGGKFDNEGRCLYYADAVLGLARVCDLQSSSGANPELLASRVKLDDGSWSPINLADDVDIGPKTGHVYFSDASYIPVDRDFMGRWDITYASKLEGLSGKRTGRLLRYKPETGEVDVLATDAVFANGVAVDADEASVLYVSSFDATVMKYHLSGPQEGKAERLLDRFPGYLDGVDCSSRKGLCYVAVVSTIPPIVRVLFSLPPWIHRPLRSLMMGLPRAWLPPPEPYGGAAEVYPGGGDGPARVRRVFQDPDGRDVGMITGVTERGGKLYLGSLHNDFVGVVSLD